MGKKDYQQYFLIKNYLKNKYKAAIIQCKTVRNNNKMALSSRNNHLDLNGIKKASYLSKSLIKSKNGIGMVRAIKHLVSKRLVNVYKYNGLQLTVNSVSELREARNKIGKYVTFS